MVLNKEEKDFLLDEIYDIAKQELRAEIYEEMFQRKEKKVRYTELAKKLYDKFNYNNPTVLKHLKRELPLRVSLLNKITIIGMALLYEDIIQYTYYFNNDINHVFVYKPNINDMEKWR